MILVSMAANTLQNVKKHHNAGFKWLSFAYTVAHIILPAIQISVVTHIKISTNIFISSCHRKASTMISPTSAAKNGRGEKLYTVAYSMSIPVVYHTGISFKYLFIPIEIIVSAGMVRQQKDLQISSPCFPCDILHTAPRRKYTRI